MANKLSWSPDPSKPPKNSVLFGGVAPRPMVKSQFVPRRPTFGFDRLHRAMFAGADLKHLTYPSKGRRV